MYDSGFTLIELLIVVAIIAILVAIAIPNFLNAQTRAKISRAKSDMHTLRTALEIYVTDLNSYPRGNWYQLSTLKGTTGADRALVLLSTPVAYVKNALMVDPFYGTTRDGGFVDQEPQQDTNEERLWYKYSACNDRGRIIGTVNYPDHDDPTVRVHWVLLQSCGPDRTRHTLGDGALREKPENFRSTIYDPTNGLVSRGSIYSVGGSPTGVGGIVFRAVKQASQ